MAHDNVSVCYRTFRRCEHRLTQAARPPPAVLPVWVPHRIGTISLSRTREKAHDTFFVYLYVMVLPWPHKGKRVGIHRGVQHTRASLSPSSSFFSTPYFITSTAVGVFGRCAVLCASCHICEESRPTALLRFLLDTLSSRAPTCSLSLALHGRGALGNWQQNSLSRTTGSAAHRLEAFALRTITTSRLNLRYSTTCALISLDHAQEKGPGL